MTSGKTARKQRRTPAPPPVRSMGGKRASPKVLAAGAAVIAVAAVGAALAFALTGGSSSSSTPTTSSTLPDAAAAVSMFRGIPQNGIVLGKSNAPVTMIEYIDLQCPFCRAFETDVMPTIVSRFVKTGKVKVIARLIAFIGPDSARGRLAALAAAQQNRLFDFSQLVYFNQGSENTGWLDDEFVRAAYASIPGLDVAAAEKARTETAIAQQGDRLEAQATADHVTATPTVFVGKTGGKPTEVASPDVGTLSAAIRQAGG